jgi:hypothetical protein
MTSESLVHTRALLTALEGQGYTHLCWSCLACGLECARGLQLLRIRGRLKKDSTAISVGRQLRCPRCFHRPEPDMVWPSKGRSVCANTASDDACKADHGDVLNITAESSAEEADLMGVCGRGKDG